MLFYLGFHFPGCPHENAFLTSSSYVRSYVMINFIVLKIKETFAMHETCYLVNYGHVFFDLIMVTYFLGLIMVTM